MSSLTPGSVARIYRDGTLIAPAVDIPADGRMELRNLQPGQYELRDECGGSELIEVTHATEVVVVVPGGDDGPVAAADSTRQEPDAVPVPEPEPIYPGPQDPATLEDVDPEWRVTLPASEDELQAGAPGEQPSPAVIGAAADMTVAQLRDALRAQGKPVSGNKDELIARVEGNDGAA